MLTPSDLEAIAEDVTRIYEGVQSECIKSIVDHITAGKNVTQASVWQMKKLNDVGLLKRDLYKWVAKKTGETTDKIEKLVETALSKSMGVDISALQKSLSQYNTTTMQKTKEAMRQSPEFRKLLENATAGCVSQCKGIINLTNTKAIQASVKAYTDAVNRAYLEMATGNYTYEQAVERAVGAIGKSGIKIVDSKEKATSGEMVGKGKNLYTTYATGNGVRVYPLDSAIRRDITTTINQSCAKLTLDSCGEMDCGLVETSWHVGARPEHEKWQGRIFSLNPKDTRYPYFYASQEAGGTGYGDMLGLCGINCYHSFNPYFEGSQRSTDENKPSAEENAKAYKEQQQQRAYERNLRSLKREQMAYVEGGFIDKAQDTQRRINDLSHRYRQFLNDTGRTRVSMLDKVSGYSRISTKAGATITPPAPPTPPVQTLPKTPKAPVTPPPQPQPKPQPKLYDPNPNCSVAKTFGKDGYDSYVKLLDNCGNENIRNAYKSVENITIKKTRSKTKAFYRSWDDSVTINPSEVKRGSYYEEKLQTLFHELGHAVDYHATGAHMSNSEVFSVQFENGRLRKCILEDVKNLTQLCGGEDRIKDVIVNHKMVEYADFSDIIEGATEGRVRLGFGHGKSYWASSPSKLPKEAFAELLDSFIANEDSYDFLLDKMPLTTECFEDMLKALKF